MAAKAADMRARGVGIISFATGEPDFDTPQNIKDKAKRALDEGLTKYPPSSGLSELRNAISQKLLLENNLSYQEDEIVVTCGAKQAIYNALQVIINPGDEVLIPAPFWVSYPDQVKLADGKPIIISTTSDTNFKLTPNALERHVTPKTRAIIINTPSNPSGSAYSSLELAGLGRILSEHGVAIISDEIYEKLVYGDFKHTSIVCAWPAARDSTFVINGVAKAYAMTGWRMGYAAGPREAIGKMAALVGQQITGIPPFVQKACIEALSGPQDDVANMKREFEARRDLMFELMLSIPNLKCHKPDGAFYLLPNVGAYLGKEFQGKKMANADALVDYLLDEAHIATVSGTPFGAPGHIRFSYATSRANIEKGMERLKNALAKLR